MATTEHPDLLSPAEVAERLNLDLETVRRRIRAGQFPGAVKLGDHQNAPWRIPVDALDEQFGLNTNGRSIRDEIADWLDDKARERLDIGDRWHIPVAAIAAFRLRWDPSIDGMGALKQLDGHEFRPGPNAERAVRGMATNVRRDLDVASYYLTHLVNALVQDERERNS